MMDCSISPGFIGVFDSGVGGLTVVRRILEQTDHRVVFVADQAHVPYGGRPLEEISHFAGAISEALIEAGASAVIMACNISTATALFDVQRKWPDLPIHGVIGPGAADAYAQSQSGRIGVLATLGTVKTGAYTRAVQAISPEAYVREVACPRFVPLIESGNLDSPETEAAALEVLTPIIEDGCDVAVLGCTHYPYLLPVLQRLAPQVRFVDPAVRAVRLLLADLYEGADRSLYHPKGGHTLLTTGSKADFESQIPMFLPGPEADFGVDVARWQSGRLCLVAGVQAVVSSTR